MSDSSFGEPADQRDRQSQVAGRLLHDVDRFALVAPPHTDGDDLREFVDRRLAQAAEQYGGSPADYRSEFVRMANQHGWELAEDGSNWDERWRELRAAGRRRARWDEIRDALEDLD